MRIEIITVNDESFAIYPPSNNVEETPVEETPVEETPVEETPVEETPVEETPVEEVPVEEVPVVEVEQVVEETPQPPDNRCASIENPKETNSFDWFSGTSWGGKKQGF